MAMPRDVCESLTSTLCAYHRRTYLFNDVCENAWHVYESRTKFVSEKAAGNGKAVERKDDTLRDAAKTCQFTYGRTST